MTKSMRPTLSVCVVLDRWQVADHVVVEECKRDDRPSFYGVEVTDPWVRFQFTDRAALETFAHKLVAFCESLPAPESVEVSL